tara:strand:+ start:58 stop:261 length:204 start_codon:yes stop_codon:yes gene_type:complete
MTIYIIINNEKIEAFRSIDDAEAYVQSEYPELSEECNDMFFEDLVNYINNNRYGSVKCIQRKLIEQF